MPPETSHSFPSGFYLVAVPIGHMDDIGLRALSLLSCAHFILCEDTRQTLSLLRAHGILKNQRLLSADEHRWEKHCPLLQQELLEGNAIVAFVSDAGTPGICDPGAGLVSWLRSRDYRKITALPGPSALSTFLSLSGRSFDSVLFVGFFPRKSGLRESLFAKASQSGAFCVGFESPRRVKELLADFALSYGNECHVVLARELTKTHEQIFSGSVGNALEAIRDGGVPELGEWVVGIEVPQKVRAGWQEVAATLNGVWEKKKLSSWLAEHFHVSKHEAYDFLIGKTS